MPLFDALCALPSQSAGQNLETRIPSSAPQGTCTPIGSPEGEHRGQNTPSGSVFGLYTTPHAPESRIKTDHIRENKWGENDTSKDACPPKKASEIAYVPPKPCSVYQKTGPEMMHVPPQGPQKCPMSPPMASPSEAWGRSVVIRCRLRKAFDLLVGGANFTEAQWQAWWALWLELETLHPHLTEEQGAIWWSWLDREGAGPAFEKAEQAWASMGELEGAIARWGRTWADAIWVAVQAFAKAQEPLAIKRAGGRLAALVTEAEVASKELAA